MADFLSEKFINYYISVEYWWKTFVKLQPRISKSVVSVRMPLKNKSNVIIFRGSNILPFLINTFNLNEASQGNATFSFQLQCF